MAAGEEKQHLNFNFETLGFFVSCLLKTLSIRQHTKHNGQRINANIVQNTITMQF